jgi:hypothetical protein
LDVHIFKISSSKTSYFMIAGKNFSTIHFCSAGQSITFTPRGVIFIILLSATLNYVNPGKSTETLQCPDTVQDTGEDQGSIRAGDIHE